MEINMNHTLIIRKFLLTAICLGIINSAWGDDMPEDVKKNIHIKISGSMETTYSANWTITQSNGETKHVHESGHIPANYSYNGEAIAGTVTQLGGTGRLEVEIRKNGNHSKSSTQGKGSVLTISVR